MANEPENVGFWANADVLVSFDLDAAVPATVDDAFSADWHTVGILDGDDGFTHSEEEDSTDNFGWGGIDLGERNKNFKRMSTFTALEYNQYTRQLMYPGSADGEIGVPDRSIHVLLAFETRDGDKIRRRITKYKARVKLAGDVADNETDPSKIQFEARILPDPTTAVHWIEQPEVGGATVSSVLITGTATMAVGALCTLVATATYSDATTRDVTASAVWTSATPAKATIPYGSGYCLGIAAGTSVVTATYAGVSDTQTVTVTS